MQLQSQVTSLTATNSTPATIVFADTPQSLNAENILDYSTKRGSSIYEQGCKPLDDKALPDGFNMTSENTVAFVEALIRRASEGGWNMGSKQITTFKNAAGKDIDIIREYGQIDEHTLKTACERFCKPGGADVATRAKQNNTMMAICLAKSLTAEASSKLLVFRTEYTFDDVEYAPLMYKIIMRIATIDTIATTRTLRNNLHNLGVYGATVHGDVHKINEEFNRNYTQLLSRGATVDDPVGLLFDAYLLIPCYEFKTYMKRSSDDYLDGKSSTLTHQQLMSSASNKYNYLHQKGLWDAKSSDSERIIAMASQFEALKGNLKADKHLEEALSGNSKTRNKKNKGDKSRQKEDEAWKKIPPSDGDRKSKDIGKHTYHWCIHHMAWCMHQPNECRLGLQRKNEQAPSTVANSASVAAAAAAIANPHFQALLSTIGSLRADEWDK